MNITKFVTEYKDVITVTFSTLSLLIACTSLYFSVRNNIKDKARLMIVAKSCLHPVYDGVYKIEITVTNVGRRIAALEGLICHYEQGYKSHTNRKDGLFLKEKERVTLFIDRGDLVLNGEEGEVYQLEDITVRDNEHREYKINNSKELVARLSKGF
ncbi:hypothetical protein Q7S_14155 [Rahnella aquatilis HX2]|nr:hypothetical protein Q7S_14155 [Rahnella aquatilis HX2]